MFINFGLQSYETARYNQPDIVLENWYAEQAPELPNKGAQLVPTPGLTSFATGLAGTEGNLIQSDGYASGKIITQVGTAVHTITNTGTVATLTGSVQAPQYRPQFALSQTPELVAVSGGIAYKIDADGDAISTITIANASGVITGVAELNQRHFFVEAGSGRLHISDAADATTVTAFVTAEDDPDEIRAIVEWNNYVWCFGTRTTQIAYGTGSVNTPVAFRPTTVPIGVFGRRSVAAMKFDIGFVANDARVMLMAGGRPQQISTDPISDLIRAVPQTSRDLVTLDAYTFANTEFLLLTIPDVGQYQWDQRTRFWHRLRTLDQWHGDRGAMLEAYGQVYTLQRGSSTPKVLRLDRDSYTHDGATVRRVARAPFPVQDGRVTLRNLSLEAFTGVGLDGDVQGSDPQLMFRWAPDGVAFGPEIQRSMGKIGEYRKRITFGPLGIARPGVALFEIAYSDPVGMTVLGAMVNAVDRT